MLKYRAVHEYEQGHYYTVFGGLEIVLTVERGKHNHDDFAREHGHEQSQ